MYLPVPFEDRSPNFALKRPEGKLFDFQEEAARFCTEKLRANTSCVLALATGCGKTCTVRQVILSLGAETVLYVAPGGLCRQLKKALSTPPWGSDGHTLKVLAAETGKQLQAALLANQKAQEAGEVRTWDVLIVNRALGIWNAFNAQPSLVIIDEAHQNSDAAFKTLRLLHLRTLFVTATPGESLALRKHFIGISRKASELKRFADACFYFAKTERVMKELGTARTELKPIWNECQDLPTYYMKIIHRLNQHFYDDRHGLSQLAAVLAAAKHARENCITLDLRELLRVLLPKAIERAGFVHIGGERFFHESAAAQVLAGRCIATRVADVVPREHLPALPRNFTDALDRARQLEAQERRDDVGQGELPGFGLQPHEYEALFWEHVRASPTPPLWVENGRSTFSAALVRLPHRTAVEAAAQELCQSHADLQVFKLHTGMSAATRASTVRKFTSFGGDRAKLRFFVDGLRRSQSELSRAVVCLGFGHVVRELYRFVAKPRILLADDTIDVGFDLHRHVDTVLLPTLVPDRTTLLQFVGRVSRIATDVGEQGSIDIMANLTRGSLDSFFERRLRRDVIPAPSEGRSPLDAFNEEMEACIWERLEDGLEKVWFSNLLLSVKRI